MIMELQFSTEIKQVAAVFKEYRNSIDIYTEDKIEDKQFYIKLFNKLLDNTGLIINDIHQLGNKRAVIDACEKDKDDRRRRLYMVDGDICLQYENKPILPNLFVLDAYCIENYMLSNDALCYVANDINGGRMAIQDIERELNYEEELKDITYPLINLFFAFSVQHQLGGMFNLKHIKSFITTSKSLDEKIREEIDMIRETFVKNGKQSEFDKLFEERKMKFPYSEDTLLTIVSGKDYLIPYFSERIKKIVGSFQVPREWWKYKMVEKVDVDRLNALKTALVSS